MSQKKVPSKFHNKINPLASSETFGSNILNADYLPTSFDDQISLDQLESADSNWNFFRSAPEDLFNQLCDSIKENGLISPILVWAKDAIGSKYMILSGHNRVRAYQHLLSETNDQKYAKIPAKVFAYNKLNEDMAQEIIIDANYISRTLTPSERAKSILRKYTNVAVTKRWGEGRRADLIAKQYNCGTATISRYLKLNDLIEPLLKMIDDDRLSLRNAYKVAEFDIDKQEWLFENYSGFVNKKTIQLLNNKMSKEDIAQILTNGSSVKTSPEKAWQKKGFKVVKLPVLPEKLAEFSEIIKGWMNNNCKDYKNIKIDDLLDEKCYHVDNK